MNPGWRLTLKSCLLSLILHLAMFFFLVLSFKVTPSALHVSKSQDVNIVEAVAVDKRQVEIELARIKKIEEEKRRKEDQRIKAMEKKAQQLADRREAEEQRLLAAKKKKQQEQIKFREEKKKLAEMQKIKQQEQERLKQNQLQIAELKKKAEELKQKREIEELKVQKAKQQAARLKAEEEARKKREAEVKRKKEEERQRQLAAERERKEEAEKKRRQDELADALLAEEEAERKQKDQQLISTLKAEITQSIENNFNLVGLPDGLECKLLIRLIPGGEVVNVSITKSSGNNVFDNRAVNATQKASPLPVPDDPGVFERLKLRQINMTFRPAN